MLKKSRQSGVSMFIDAVLTREEAEKLSTFGEWFEPNILRSFLTANNLCFQESRMIADYRTNLGLVGK